MINALFSLFFLIPLCDVLVKLFVKLKTLFILINATNGNLNHTNFLGTTPDTGDISNAYMFLASEKSKFITGFNLVVDGGRHLGTKGTAN